MTETSKDRIQIPIDNTMVEWMPNVKAELPILTTDIPDFKSWIAWHGFTMERGSLEGHDGYDFAAYLTKKNTIVFGLPEQTPVRAIAKGTVKEINLDYMGFGGYYDHINIEHGKPGAGMLSHYGHIVINPNLRIGMELNEGDVLGTVFKDSGVKSGRLVHLHFSLISAPGTHGTPERGGQLRHRFEDPGFISQSIYGIPVENPAIFPFVVPSHPDATIIQNHFDVVRFKA